MARIRSVHPGFFTDENLVSVSMAARLLFIGLGVEADDKGTFEWKPLTIKMRLFPADNVDVEALLSELSAAGALLQYEVEGRKLGAIRNFRKYQRPKTPNDIHPAPENILQFVGLEGAVSEKREVKEKPFPPKGEKPPQMEEGEEDGEEEVSSNDDCASGDALAPRHVKDEWNLVAKQLGRPCIRDLTPSRRDLCKARIAQYSLEDFVVVFGKVRDSPFLRGERGWKGATFDWTLKRANFQKILEGNYDG